MVPSLHCCPMSCQCPWKKTLIEEKKKKKKDLTYAYLVKTSMTHNKYLTFLFLEANYSVSAKSAAQILSLNLTYTFLLLNFVITGLCNSSASCSFTLIPDPVFLSNNL